MAHKHKAKTERTVGWSHCVAGARGCNGMAHGGVTFVATCVCGAERKIESNGNHTESSGWYMPEGK